MEPTLETVALFALKLAHETDDASPVLRDEPRPQAQLSPPN